MRQTRSLRQCAGVASAPGRIDNPPRASLSWFRGKERILLIGITAKFIFYGGALLLAVPVFDARGQVCGSISVGIPKPRYAAPLGKQIAAHLKDVSKRLSAVLEAAGYQHEQAH